jgi:prepilin-type N-terminal cleavage/methylation domain-containing protein
MRPSLVKYNKGMTLVELLVVLSIFAIISMTVAFNYGNYKSTTSTNVLAQNVALSIREAQGYAMGVKSAYVDGSNIFPGYGVHFNPSASGLISGSSKSFILFADIPPDDVTPANLEYDFPQGNGEDESRCDGSVLGNNNECISVNTISGGDKIVGVCANISPNMMCDNNQYSPEGSLDILFRRPNPDARFCYRQDPDQVNCSTGVSAAGVVVQSESDPGILKQIIVWNTGQISVK